MSDKGAKERLELFQQKDNYEPGDPRLVLMDRVLNELPIEKQIECIVSAFKAKEVCGFSDRHVKEIKTLITALRKLFQELDREQLEPESGLFFWYEEGKAYVDCLMDIYKTISTYTPNELMLILLREIASLWDVRYHPDFVNYGDDSSMYSEWDHERKAACHWQSLEKNSQRCFEFLCWAFGTEPMSGQTKIQKGILEIFRNRLDVSYMDQYSVNQLNRWILSKDVPNSIMTTLLKARARVLGAIGKQEVAFLEVFDLHNRTPKAIERVETLMKEIKETEESEGSEGR